MAINQRTANMLEGIGLVLILITFLIQLLENGVDQEVRENANLEVQTKLDALWTVVSTDYAEKHPKDSVYKGIVLKNVDAGWKYYEQNRQKISSWKAAVHADITTTIRITLFLLGSIFLIIPKFAKVKP